MLVNQIASQLCELGPGFARTQSAAYREFAKNENVPKRGEVCLELTATYRDGSTTLVRQRFLVSALSQASEDEVKQAILSQIPQSSQLRKLGVTQLPYPGENFVLPWLKVDSGLPSAEFFFSS
mmetsp:Transcript_16110/g.26568  ORF Transcript_16110/g.26568 Transcript_16110/m.26568 type:complete len:123 (+) Transcript_16110:176-544(+)